MLVSVSNVQKQLSRDVLRERCSEDMRQIYRRTLMRKCGLNKVAKLLCNFGKMILRNIPKIENISKIKLDDY